MHFKKVYIEITNFCNKHCSFCSIDSRKKEEMSISNFEHVIKEIQPYTNYIYLHVKGEPLLHSNFLEILELCEKYHMTVNITTNGTLLKQQLSNLLRVSNIRQINISLHSFAGEQDYMKNILFVTDQLLSQTNCYINYRFWTLDQHQLTEKNKWLITEIENHFSISLFPLLEQYHHATINPHLFIEEGEKFDWPTLTHSFYSDKGTCYGLRTHIAILVDGTVVPCCLDSDAKIKLGNIFQESFSTILEKKRTQRMIQNFQNHKIEEELCKHCTYRNRF